MLDIRDDIILVLPNDIRNRVIKDIRNRGLCNIKFMSLDELKHKFYFDYNKETIYYLMKRYNYKYDIAKMYLDNLYYSTDNIVEDKKMLFLSDIKKELDTNKLLIYDKLFKDSLIGKELVIYGYNSLMKEDIILVDKLREIVSVNIVEDNRKEYEHSVIYEFNNIEDEVTYVCEDICRKISAGIGVNNIKICVSNSEYNNIIERMFRLYNLPIVMDKGSLYSTKLVRYFLDNLGSDIDKTLDMVEAKFNLNNSRVNDIYNKFIDILNDYSFCGNYLDVREMLIHDFKNTKISKIKLEHEIEIITDLDNVTDLDYVYLLGFNQGDIPKPYKDSEYLDDNLRLRLGLDTATDKNKTSIDSWVNNIRRVKNLVISYKTNNSSGECYLSSLNDYLECKIEKGIINYKYSNKYNKLVLGDKIDTYLKYNEKDSGLDKLYSTYQDIDYGIYDNGFTGVDKDEVIKYMDNKLTLSYSTINDYYHCGFKYYLSNILKLNIFKETFMTVLGNLFHYILSICFDREIDLDKEYSKYIDSIEYELSSKERYFLDKLKEELIFIIDAIKKQYQYNSLDNVYYEEKIVIDKSTKEMEIVFKGFIDKLMLDSDDMVASIIDYKTGNPDISLNNSIYGLDLQLPVYVYLTKKRFPNIRIVGFYLQKILNSRIKRDSKVSYDEAKRSNLRLQGYTNCDEDLIKLFDSDYQESKVIKGMKTTSKGLGTKKVLDDVKIDKLSDLVDNKIDDAINDIVSGEFKINPKRVGTNNIGCLYCKYKDICYMTENDIVNLKEYKNLEFLD